MRILLASDSYPPLIGGATRDTAVLAEQLVERGHRVDVVTVGQPGLPRRETRAGVSVHRVDGATARLSRDPHRRHHPPVPDPVTAWRVRSLAEQVRPDVVHTYGWLSYSVARAVGRTVPLILSVRDYSNLCAVRTLMRELPEGSEPCSGPALGKCLQCAGRYYGGAARAAVSVGGVLGGRAALARRLQGVHYCSSYVAERVGGGLFEDLPAAQRPIERIIPGFRLDDTEPADETVLTTLPTEPFILFVGALRRIKGVQELFEAYGRLSQPPPLVLMGPVTTDTPSLVPSGVQVFHSVPHATVMAAWDRAMFGVAPSTLPEPFGNVVHEAMSRGVAVIGTAPSGMSDMIEHEVSGLLIPRGDVAALVVAMQRLVDEPALRHRLGATAIARSGAYTRDSVVPQFEELYRSVLHGH